MEKSHHHLAWHETMEFHELVAFQSNALISIEESLQRYTG